MDGESAARQHLEELERHREEQPGPPEPLWYTAVWVLTWLAFSTSTLLMGDSDWIFLVFAVTIASFGALMYAQRRRAGSRPPRRTPMTTRDKWMMVLAVAVVIGVFTMSVRYETPWPLLALTWVASVIYFVLVRRDAHRATPQDERRSSAALQ